MTAFIKYMINIEAVESQLIEALISEVLILETTWRGMGGYISPDVGIG